jgi:hypothetical protein|tara:strand:+ start:471 stop:800 length:330 start_codon:yes stop_codon:yes gene_type:complete
MGMINLGSSMRYGPNGKKRKTNAWKETKKNTIMAYQQGKHEPSLKEKQIIEKMDEFDKKYPSYQGTSSYNPLPDTSYKKEASKNFTVAIGYNKGGYQVIPKNEIKHIGK